MSNVITGGRPGALAHAAEDSHIICASSMQRARRLLLLQRRCYLIVGRFSPKPLPVSTPVALVVQASWPENLNPRFLECVETPCGGAALHAGIFPHDVGVNYICT